MNMTHNSWSTWKWSKTSYRGQHIKLTHWIATPSWYVWLLQLLVPTQEPQMGTSNSSLRKFWKAWKKGGLSSLKLWIELLHSELTTHTRSVPSLRLHTCWGFYLFLQKHKLLKEQTELSRQRKVRGFYTLAWLASFCFTPALSSFNSVILFTSSLFHMYYTEAEVSKENVKPSAAGKGNAPLLQSANNLCTIWFQTWEVSVYRLSNSNTFCVGLWILDWDATE